MRQEGRDEHLTTARSRIRGGFLRLLYKLLAPRHPRGWLDFHAIWEQDQSPGQTLWIHCHGMERWQLPNLEIVGVPDDLRGNAHGLMCELVGYMKNVKPMKADENFGGPLVDERQLVMHFGTVRAAPERDQAHSGFLRVVDLDQPVTAGFPAKLFAAHLAALADLTRNVRERERLLRRSTEIFPGEVPADRDAFNGSLEQADMQAIQSRTNLRGWEGLSMVLAMQDRYDEAIACYEQAVVRCPGWARHFAGWVAEEAGKAMPPREHPLTRFWLELDIDKIRARLLASHPGTEPRP